MKLFKLAVPLLAIAAILAGCFGSSKKEVRSIDPQEVMGQLKNGFAVLVDVREEDEIKGGMAAQAEWMPMSKIRASDPAWEQFVAKLPKDKEIVFYCGAGGRAGDAAQRLAEKGYRTANMGGFKDWKAAGLPVK
jgi:rhodanese-related sulfurtransferase